MDDSCASIQLVDVVSPTLQTEEDGKSRLIDILPEIRSPQSLVTNNVAVRSPSCEPSKTKGRKDGHTGSIYTQRHRSTPSRRRKAELFEPAASPLRMVLTQNDSSSENTSNLHVSISKESISEASEYASINMKKESLRKLLAELSTSPRQVTNEILSPGRLCAESLRVSPIKSDTKGTAAIVECGTKTSIALSPLHIQSDGVNEQELKIQEYITKIAQLEEQVKQRESEMKELMIVVLSNDLLKKSTESEKVAELTEQLKCKENELRQMVEFLADEQKQKSNVESIGIQTDQSDIQLHSTKNTLDTVYAKKSYETLCTRCHRQLLQEGGDITNMLDKNTNKGNIKKQSRANSKRTLVQAKSVPTRQGKNVASTPLQTTKNTSRSRKNIHILEQLLQSPSANTQEIHGSQTLPLAQFALSPPVSVTESSIAQSLDELYTEEEQVGPSQYLLNTSVSAVSDLVGASDPGIMANPSETDPLFDAVFSILTGIAK